MTPVNVSPLSAAIRSKRWLEMRDPLATGLVFLAIVIWPIYLLPPGFPQPVTLAFIAGLICIFVRNPASLVDLFRGDELSLIAAFFGYSLVVNLAVSIAYQDIEPLRHSSYYLQVVLSCAVMLHVLRTEPQAPRILFLAVLSTLILQAVVLGFSASTEGVRQTLLFANPNQLGFFSLLAISLLLLLRSRGAGSSVSILVGILLSLAFVLLSLSKAAILSVLVLLVLYGLFSPVQHPRLKRFKPVLIVVIPSLLVAMAFAYRNEIELLSVLSDRFSSLGETGDDSLAGRSYVRLVMWPQYLIVGGGEGLLQRWEYPREIHSMIGTLLFSYGLPGTLIVLSLFAVCCRRNLREFCIFFVPVLLYSLTHQPMRQVMMWALLLLIAHQPPMRSGPSTA